MSLLAVSGARLAAADSSTAGSPVSQALLLEYLGDNSTFTLVDARTSEEFADSHIAGAIHLPLEAEKEDFAVLPGDRDSPIVVYCKTGKRATLLQQKLMAAGYANVRVLQPTQIVWFDGLAVFNCAVDSSAKPGDAFDELIIEGKSE